MLSHRQRHFNHRKLVIPNLGPMTAALAVANLASPPTLLYFFTETHSRQRGCLRGPSQTSALPAQVGSRWAFLDWKRDVRLLNKFPGKTLANIVLNYHKSNRCSWLKTNVQRKTRRDFPQVWACVSSARTFLGGFWTGKAFIGGGGGQLCPLG